jgi:hypothetical protein
MKATKLIALFGAFAVVATVGQVQAQLPAALRGVTNAQVMSDQDASQIRGESGSISTWGSFNFQHNTVEGAQVAFANNNINVLAAGESASVSFAGNAWDPTGLWARSGGGAYKSLSVDGGASGDIHVGPSAWAVGLKGAGNIAYQETKGTLAQGTVGQFQFNGGSRNGLDIGIGGSGINVNTLGGAFSNTTAIGAGTFSFPGSLR